MGIGALVVLVGCAAALLYGVVIYNQLVRLKHGVEKAWSNIDVLLRQRHDELPKLIEVCRQYMSYEQETLKQVVEARSKVAGAQAGGDVRALGHAEGALRLGLGNLFAVAENYPDLKADQTFRHLQQRISGLENSIADRREFYNESANNDNVRIEQFPDVMLARVFDFKPFELLEFSDEEKLDVDLKKLFG